MLPASNQAATHAASLIVLDVEWLTGIGSDSASSVVATTTMQSTIFHSPSPPAVMAPDSELMLHSVSAHQHAMLAAAVTLQQQVGNEEMSLATAAAMCINNHAFAGRITGIVDVYAFHACMQAVVKRHTALRTNFQQLPRQLHTSSDASMTDVMSPNLLQQSSSSRDAIDWDTSLAPVDDSHSTATNIAPPPRFGQLVHSSDSVLADFRYETVEWSNSCPPVDTISTLQVPDVPTDIVAKMDRAAHEPFNVFEAPSLFRVRLFNVQPPSLRRHHQHHSHQGQGNADSNAGPTAATATPSETTLFVFSLSSLVGDVWSMTVILDDFRLLYAATLNMPTHEMDFTLSGVGGTLHPDTARALDEMNDAVLEPLALDYLVYADWQKQRLLLGQSGGAQQVQSQQQLQSSTQQPVIIDGEPQGNQSLANSALLQSPAMNAMSTAPAPIDQAAAFASFWSELLSGTLPTLALPNLVERPKPADVIAALRQYGGFMPSELAQWRQRESASVTADASVSSSTEELELPAFVSFPFTLPVAVTRRLKDLAAEERTELYTLFLAAWHLFLFRYTGADDIIIGAEASCRAAHETQNVVGPFVNTVLYRANTSGNPVFRTFLAAVRAQAIGVRAHSDYPFALLLHRLHASTSQISATNALFPSAGSAALLSASISFEYPESSRFQDALVYTVAAFASGVKGPSTHVGGIALQPLPLRPASTMLNPHSASPLQVTMSEVDGEIRGWLRVSAQMYTTSFAQRMLGHWSTLLSNVVMNPDLKLSDQSLLGADERHLLLHGWNSTAVRGVKFDQHNPTKARLLHQWVEARAALCPQAIAVEFNPPDVADATTATGGPTSLTYHELNSRANSLAHYLRYLGASIDEPIPIVLERSPLFVIALLAVLKSGAAAMPIDVKVPDQRLQFLLQSADATVVLTDNQNALRCQQIVNAVRKSKNDTTNKNTSSSQHTSLVLNLSSSQQLLSRGNMANLPPVNKPDSVAYVLFTSGSTGQSCQCNMEYCSALCYTTT